MLRIDVYWDNNFCMRKELSQQEALHSVRESLLEALQFEQ